MSFGTIPDPRHSYDRAIAIALVTDMYIGLHRLDIYASIHMLEVIQVGFVRYETDLLLNLDLLHDALRLL